MPNWNYRLGLVLNSWSILGGCSDGIEWSFPTTPFVDWERRGWL